MHNCATNVRRPGRGLIVCGLVLAVSSASLIAGTYNASFAHYSGLPLQELKTELERAGWPEPHMQAFINAEIQRRFNTAFEVKTSDLRPFEFWRTGPDAQPIAPAYARAATQERSRREEAARQAFDALFPPGDSSSMNSALLTWEEQRRWGTLLSAEKRTDMAALLERTEQERREFFDKRGGMLTRLEWDIAWTITEGGRAALARLLTPDELLDFDMRNSVTAERMRNELDNFQPTREEFVTIFKLRHPLELIFGHKPPGVDTSIDRERTAAEDAVEKQIADVLGSERYDEYRISLQPACQTLQFDGRFAQAEAATIRKLYRSLLATKARLAELSKVSGEKSEETALKDALYREFHVVLDEEGARRYLQEQGLWP